MVFGEGENLKMIENIENNIKQFFIYTTFQVIPKKFI